MQRLVDGFDDPAYVVRNDPWLTIESWNHGIEQKLHRAAEDAIGRPAFECLRPTLDRVTRAHLEDDLRRRHWWIGTTTLLDTRERPVAAWGICCPVQRASLSDPTLHYLTVLPRGMMTASFFPLIATSSAPQGSAAPFTDLDNGWQLLDLVDGETPKERRKRTIGENIARYREAKHLSRYALARDLGIERSQLIKWETGTWEPSAAHIAELADLLGVPDWTFYIPQERVA
jgi:DNA-binding XRE family transcriptional regulator